ncbi:MAG: flagellin lysine-N-methylase [Sarcina sp.]
MKESLQISIFNKFSCIADKCKFTCCSGWNINIDNDTYNNLKVNNINFVVKRIEEKDNKYFIKKEIEADCPFLDKIGLCEIVKNVGDKYLSNTCRNFPRIENKFDDFEEFTLSCACPEVVDIIDREKQKVEIRRKLNENIIELEIRDKIIEIIRKTNISMEKKLIIAYRMFEEMLEEKNVNNVINKFDDMFIREMSKVYDEVEIERYEAIEELNCLFMDITQNYKDVKVLNVALEDIYNFADEVDFEEAISILENFKEKFDEHNGLIEECIVIKILSSCVNVELNEMLVAFELIVLEYILMRYAVLLKLIKNEEKKIDIQDIKDYIVVFSRVVGNNIIAIREFIRDGFGSEILELGYLSFIGLF